MNFKRALAKVKFDAAQKAPAAMIVAGIGLGVAAIVEFCRKSREALPVIDEYKETVAELTESHNTVVAFAEKEGKTDIIKNEHANYCKEMAIETAKTGVKLGRIYAVPIALYAGSVALNIKSYSVMRDRNLALAAAYAGVGNEIRRVYSRIEEKYGADAVDEIKHGIKKVEIEETKIDERTGKEVIEKKVVPVVDMASGDPNKVSPYARFFDETSRAWRDDAEYNLVWLMEREEEANRILRDEGKLLLNRVYEMLDMKHSKAGARVGWKYYPNGNNPSGDNRVSFGIHNIYRPAARDFVNGYEKVILLDFNVDGEIIDSFPLY